MKRLFAAAATALAGCACLPDPAPPAQAPTSLAAAESAFAAQSVREGMRAAFLAWFAPDAILFRDGPVNGPAAIAARPDPPIVLDWRPVFVEVAASGEIGLSTGPWTITSRKDPSAAPLHGQFVSLWKRDAGGPWRVHVDLGISHPGAALAEARLQAGSTPPPGTPPSSSIAAAEAQFASRASDAGDAAAYAAAASSSIRMYREGQAPFLGRDAALGSPAARESRTAWFLEAHEVSASGDLGYAWGRYGPRGAATAGHYVRVWRRESQGWRIALDVVNDITSR
ncbi:MAG: nuclear transport factor 2 family protein [Betaproteobacteria bacterium]|nr:nuclear transport factor 2 family protein [Betaproteobacteria bacterium]